jgi:hypothetical protein
MPNEVVMVVMEPGIGLVMPNLTTAIQNAVPRRDLDAATAAAFFRSLGGALGAAIGRCARSPPARPDGRGRACFHRGAADCRVAGCAASDCAGRYRAGLFGAFTVGAQSPCSVS